MKRLACITAIAAIALAGCSKTEEAPPAPEETTAEAEPAMTAPDGGPEYGKFEVTSADGKTVIVQDVREDGTVTNMVEGAEPVEGTWMMDDAGNFCATMAGDEAPSCYAESMTDGVWTATNIADETDSWTVVRMAEEEAPAEMDSAPAT